MILQNIIQETKLHKELILRLIKCSIHSKYIEIL